MIVGNTKMLCSLYDELEVLIPEHFAISGLNVKF